MSKKKARKVKLQDSSVSEESPSMSQIVVKWIGIFGAALTIAGVIFGFGYWVAGIEHKVEIMNLNQKHNNATL